MEKIDRKRKAWGTREREKKKFPKIKPQTKGSNRRLLEESRSNDFYSIDEIRKWTNRAKRNDIWKTSFAFAAVEQIN